MMGRHNRDQGQLFYSFCLDDAVPVDHRVREIAACWTCRGCTPSWRRTTPTIGRPSIDPVLMIRMLIVGYVFAIRSERLLCREVQVNLAYRWFCGLSIEDKIPDHSAFSRARNERFRDSDIFRRVFERVVESVHCGGPGRRRRLRGRCQPDRGGRQQAAIDPGQGVGQAARSCRRRAGR